jgi:hypothetical protein
LVSKDAGSNNRYKNDFLKENDFLKYRTQIIGILVIFLFWVAYGFGFPAVDKARGSTLF